MTRPALRSLLSCRRASTAAQPPIRWVYFPQHLPYELALTLQEQLLSLRLDALLKLEADPSLSDAVIRKTAETDLLLLLQHKSVYTTGRREPDQDVLASEGLRLRALGADYISTDRGGQTTYHGPGQLVGYPIFNMAAVGMRTRTYVCLIEKFLDKLLARYQVPVIDSPHVGTFVDTDAKIASIGIQIRHRVTMHGFALNVEDSIQQWFANIVACGLTDVHATSMNTVRRSRGVSKDPLTVADIIPTAVEEFGRSFNRTMAPLEVDTDEPLSRSIQHVLQAQAL